MKVQKMLDMIEAAGYGYTMRAHGDDHTSTVEISAWKTNENTSHLEHGATPKEAARKMLVRLGLASIHEAELRKEVIKIVRLGRDGIFPNWLFHPGSPFNKNKKAYEYLLNNDVFKVGMEYGAMIALVHIFHITADELGRVDDET